MDIANLQRREIEAGQRYGEAFHENAQRIVKENYLSQGQTMYYGGIYEKEVEALRGAALENTAKLQDRVAAEREKSREKRRKQYAEEKLEYGRDITMETVPMSKTLIGYQKQWIKEKRHLEKNLDLEKAAATVDISGDMFDIVYIKGAKQHIDIKKIMHTVDVLTVLRDRQAADPAMFDRLPADQQLKLRAGIGALDALTAARDALLEQHKLNAEGGITAERNDTAEEKSSDKAIADRLSEIEAFSHSRNLENAVDACKQRVRESLNEQSDPQNYALPRKDDVQLERLKKEKEKAAQEGFVSKAQEYTGLVADRVLNNPRYSDAAKAGASRLNEDFLHTYRLLAKHRAKIAAKKALLEELDKGGQAEETAAKLRAQLLIDEQDAEYREAHIRAVRLERMFKGVCEGKPLTVAMRKELEEYYGIDIEGVKINDLQDAPDKRTQRLRELEKRLAEHEKIGALRNSLRIGNEFFGITHENTPEKIAGWVAKAVKSETKAADSVVGKLKDFGIVNTFATDITSSMYQVVNIAESGFTLATSAKDLYETGVRMKQTNAMTGQLAAQMAELRNRKNAAGAEKNTADAEKDAADAEKIEALLPALRLMQNTARIDLQHQGIKTAIDLAGFAVNVAGAATAIAAPVSVGTGLTLFGAGFVSNMVMDKRKGKMQRQAVMARYGDDIKNIKAEFRGGPLSDSDIEHAFLKFVGVRSGTLEEAGIRMVAVESRKLRADGNDGAAVTEAKRQMLKAAGLPEDADLEQILKVMGMRKGALEDPYGALNKNIG